MLDRHIVANETINISVNIQVNIDLGKLKALTMIRRIANQRDIQVNLLEAVRATNQ